MKPTLFMYLWRRGYGTTRYSANSLTRFLDARVAGLCGYQNARPNYAMLLEIPARLRAHAERLRKQADGEFEALRRLEQAASDGGGMRQHQQSVDAEHQRIEALDQQIEQIEQGIQTLLRERTVFAAGEDERFREAVKLMASEFEDDTIVSLRREAQLTSTSDDDVIVERLAGISLKKAQLEDAIEQYRNMLGGHQRRLSELESIRREFKRHGYDDVHSGFANGALLGMVLNQFLGGLLGGDKLWGELQRQQRRQAIRSNPTFGTGGFGRSDSVWHGSGGISRGGAGDGSFGGGGFRTGGGFGSGDDFRTGGGF